MKRMLIILHVAKRNGAPILILNLASLLKEKNWKLVFLLKQDGELTQSFSEYGETIVLSKQTSNKLLAKITSKIRFKFVFAKLATSIDSFDIVLSNTIVNGDLHSILKRHKRVYTYVHELKTTIEEYTNNQTLGNVIDHTKILLYPSESVKTLLKEELNILAPEYRYLPYYIPDHFLKKQAERENMRKKFGCDNFNFIIGGMGEPSWRKGTDIFLFTAKKVLQTNSNVKFVWCGGNPASTEWLVFKADIERMGLSNDVHLVPHQAEPWKVMSGFDIFYLSSREDAYPLVAVEAAMMKLPVIYFQNTGGIQELIKQEAGLSANCMDIDEACEKIVQLMQNHQLYTQLSENAREKYLSKHSAPVVNDFIDKVFP